MNYFVVTVKQNSIKIIFKTPNLFISAVALLKLFKSAVIDP